MATRDRLFTVLSAFGSERSRLSLKEIADITGLPMSTAHRLAKNLTEWGVLERVQDRRYVIGLRVWELGVLAGRASDQRALVLPYLEQLFVNLRQQIVLTVLRERGHLVVEQILGWRGVKSAVGLGETLPLHASSPGLVALAFGPRELWDSLRFDGLPMFTESTISDLGTLERTVREVRRMSLAVSEGFYFQTTSSISAPIFGYQGAFYGAVSIVAEGTALVAPAVAPPLVETARKVSTALRGRN